MNIDFAEQINLSLEMLDFQKALSIAETALERIPPTEFHAVLGKSLVSQAEDLAGWIEDFNTDRWFIDGFAYDRDEGLDPDDPDGLDWLSDFMTDTWKELRTEFLILGYERLQKAFDGIELKTPALQNARDWCEQIIIARFMELMRAAHLLTSRSDLGRSGIPWYFTEHSYDFVVRSELRDIAAT